MDLEQLHLQQMECFKLAEQNFTNLQQVVYREIPFEHFTIRLQYNPARIRSTNAKIDQKSIQKRPCFLCSKNMPKEQEGITYAGHYHIFVNPYPIFPRHFTVPTDAHTPQLIKHHLDNMWRLALDFPEYTVFYNGPGCGASAPDHFHFQMAPRHHMPLEQDIQHPLLKKTIQQNDRYSISTMENYLRTVIVIQSSKIEMLSPLFFQIQQKLEELIPQPDEAMINLLCWFEQTTWTCCIFPRKLGRPKQFYATDESQILFSPGCVDMAGMIIAPRKEDFERYSASLLADLFEQVTITPDQTKNLILTLKEITV